MCDIGNQAMNETRIRLGRDRYRDKVYGCWLGKNIGGTLGAPYEGKKQAMELTFYDPLPEQAAPNDDLDLQLVWLELLEDRGIPPRLPDLAEYWRTRLWPYPWGEYGFCARNLDRGLLPPVSGWFENYYVDEMGSPIRSEIWACVAPAAPECAAALAWRDSCLDHAGGEGMWGEMFWAAVESAAFVVSDPLRLIRIGLSMTPPSCNISRVIREVVWCYRHQLSWAEARERIVRIYGNAQPGNAIQNHGFIILGWLYGRDFGDRLCCAVNCGYDTDCTGATLGALLGILHGAKGTPARWRDPVGEGIVVHKFTQGKRPPATLADLTDRTVALAERHSREEPGVAEFGEDDAFPPDLLARLQRNDLACEVRSRDVRTAVAADGDVEIAFHYNGDPAWVPEEKRRVRVTFTDADQDGAGDIRLEAPAGWRAERAGDGEGGWFDLTAPGNPEGRNTIGVRIERAGGSSRAAFTLLGPAEAQGFPSTDVVPKCPVCRGRAGACLCVLPTNGQVRE